MSVSHACGTAPLAVVRTPYARSSQSFGLPLPRGYSVPECLLRHGPIVTRSACGLTLTPNFRELVDDALEQSWRQKAVVIAILLSWDRL